MKCSRLKILGRLMILLGIITLQIGCQSLKKDPPIQDDSGNAVWSGKKGEQPTEVWKSRPWVLCDSNIYYCAKF